MRIKRLPVLSGIAVLLAGVFTVLSAAISAHGVCACGTVDEMVIADLNEMDGIVRQYRMSHDGISPTYSELRELVSSDDWLSGKLISDVDPTSGAFTFPITAADAGKIGYAAASDGRRYILIGIGLQVTEMRLFGWKPIPVGYETPIWHPGDEAPDEE